MLTQGGRTLAFHRGSRLSSMLSRAWDDFSKTDLTLKGAKAWHPDQVT